MTFEDTEEGRIVTGCPRYWPEPKPGFWYIDE